MAQVFRIPIPREERIVMLTAALVGPGLIAVVLLLLRDVAEANDQSLRQLFDLSRGLRAAFASMVLVYVAGLLAMWSFFVVRDGTRVEVGERIVFSRPGVPLTGWFEREVSIAPEAVDRVNVERVRRGATERLELLVGAGRDEFVVDLEHAVVGESGGRRARREQVPRDQWASQPLVGAITRVTGVEPRIG